MQPMSPMSPMSPMDHQSSQQPQTSQQQQQQQQQSSNQMNDIQNNMVVDQLDVSMMQQQQHQHQQQQTMVDPMNQYRRTNGSNDLYRNNAMSNSNSSYSMQSHPSPDPICVAGSTATNGHDTMQMNSFGNGLIKMKTNGEDTNMQVHAQQSPFLLSAGPSDTGILGVNGYSMNLKQEPDVTF